MSNLQPLTIYVPAGVVRWLASEAAVTTADVHLLGETRDVTAEDVARVFLELGIAVAHAPAHQVGSAPASDTPVDQ